MSSIPRPHVTCQHCGKIFPTSPSRIKYGEAKFCSHKCNYEFRIADFEARFWRHVDKTPTCWLWTAHCTHDGYGRYGNQPRQYQAHRLSWILTNGPIPEGMFVCHKCDNPKCVNPAHLFLGTHTDNMRDKVAKKRHSHGEITYNAKLNDQKVREIRRLRTAGIAPLELARRYGCSTATIHSAVTHRTWKHVLD